MALQENLGADLGFDLGLAAAPAPQNGLDGTADFFVSTLNVIIKAVKHFTFKANFNFKHLSSQ